MKKALKLKAFMLSMVMGFALLPMTSFAQQTSDDFFRVDDAFNGNRDVLTYSLTGSLANDDFGTPLGSGLLVLTAVGAGYAIARRKRSFRKGTTLMLAALLLLGMTDCKKKAADPIVPAIVKITLNVSGDNDGSKVVVNPPHVTFENGDKVLVGYNSKYVGTLTHNGTNFSGSISAEIAGSQPLYFYFVGNKDTGTLTEGTTTSCTVNISDQSTELPVLSYSQSTKNFTGAGTYYASLHNQCGLVKFTLAKAAGSVQVGGMHTEATINFETPAITPTATTGSVSLNSKSKTEKWAILLPQDAVDAAVTVGSENLTVNVPAITRNAYIIDIPTIANTQIDISQLTDNYEAQNGEILYGTLGGNYKITIAADATVTLNGVTINGTNNSSYAWAGITCVGNATIILKDGSTNNVKGFYEDYPGIHVPSGSTLIIKGETSGTGILNASSNTDPSGSGAGIGGGWNLACGNIVIQSGSITATGSTGAAGIGSSNYGCGNITISGGSVTATGGASGAGIGSGSDAVGCGNITISGGTVTATGGFNSAGIGSGYTGRCGNITIASTVTRVTATKDAGYSIGAGYNGYCGTVTIGGVEGAITESPYTYPAPVAPSGAINGLFTVSDDGGITTKQVYFSQGNLQATCASADADGSTQETWTWQFAEHQWDYIGGLSSSSGSEAQTGNNYISGNGTVSSNGTVDLFCWSTNATYYGIHNSYDNNDYSGDFHDWGNTMSGDWRTLTYAEWGYLFNTRTTAAGTAPTINGTADARYAKAKLFGTTRGLIIFPDTYVHPDGVAYPTGINAAGNTSWDGNQYSAADWAKMEEAGCVFLPAAGNRYIDGKNNNYVSATELAGFYWSSVPYADEWNDKAYNFFFNPDVVDPSYSTKNGGCSVRLVKDAN
ncbi:MAG: hypothetical protein SPK72_07910 [Bacteroidales bacterium]|nr:hypothetical protein [Bacteroidales bacterium]